MKAVQQYFGEHNTKIGFISGAIGGFLKFITTVEASSFLKLIEAAITALICGAAGVIGKDAYTFIKSKLKK